jgi:transcription elongation GreA/GreB family factor
VRIVTPQTPVAKALLGKSVGDEVALPGAPVRVGTVLLLR